MAATQLAWSVASARSAHCCGRSCSRGVPGPRQRGRPRRRGAQPRDGLRAASRSMRTRPATPTVVDTALTVAERTTCRSASTPTRLPGGRRDRGDARRNHGSHHPRLPHRGLGGGHPNVLELLAPDHILGSSTTPTSRTPSTPGRDPDMKAVVHRMHGFLGGMRLPLQPGAPGRNGRRRDGPARPGRDRDGLLRFAGDGPHRRGGDPDLADGPPDEGGPGPRRPNDNERVLRYLAKITINPAIAQGSRPRGRLAGAGKLADVVLWRPEFLGSSRSSS